MSKINANVRAHICKWLKQEVSDDEIIEELRFAKCVYTQPIRSHRWYNVEFWVVEIDGMKIGFHNGVTTGDHNATEMGWEFDPATICEVEAKEVIKVIYEPKKEASA